MKRSQAPLPQIPSVRAMQQDYLFDMIRELAALARRSGEMPVAIHLEAILAVRRLHEATATLARRD